MSSRGVHAAGRIMSDLGTPKPNKATILVGILFAAVGMFPLLAMTGVLPQGQQPTDPAPSWMGWLIELAFGCAGIIIIVRGLTGSVNSSGDLPPSARPSLRLLNDTLSIVVVCSLATMFTWVAFGPGPRHFSISAGGLFFHTSGSADIFGRIAFGMGSIIGWCIAVLMAVTWARRKRR